MKETRDDFFARHDPLGVRSWDRKRIIRAELEDAEAARVAEAERMEARHQCNIDRHVRDETVAGHEVRIAELERENAALREDLHELARSVSTAVETIADGHIELNRSTRDEIRELKIEVLQLREVAANLRVDRAEGFKFAREKSAADDIIPPSSSSRRDN
jgi:hypothetical protein